MRAANKVIYNTGILYLKMLITVGISLYSTRLVLNALGAIDYGIYNLIAGVVAMLSFLNAAMTTSTQRYLSFHQGQGNDNIQKQVFINSMLLHIGIGGIIVLGLLIASLFLFNGFLNIPPDKVYTARVIYYFMIFTIFITVISVPFTASLNAHENMLWVAIVNIIEVFLKLGTALTLFIFTGDRLIFYGMAMAGISIVSFLFYTIYCFRNYKECSLSMKGVYNPKMIKELTSFAGWNLFGALCGVGRTQGLAIILNLFFGTIVNAAYGIANQISAQLNFFSVTLLKALNPQIMKSEGAGDRSRMLRLSMMASKFGFFLLAFIAIPCIFEMPAILKFWLKEVPNYTIVFCMLTLVYIMTNQLTIGLQSAIQAAGKIKTYQVIVGLILLSNLPISYLILYWHGNLYLTLVSAIIIELIACLFRLFFLKIKVGLSILEYIQKVFRRELLPVLSSIITCILIISFLSFEYRFFFTIFVSIIVFGLMTYIGGLEPDEKVYLKRLINDKIRGKIKR